MMMLVVVVMEDEMVVIEYEDAYQWDVAAVHHRMIVFEQPN